MQKLFIYFLILFTVHYYFVIPVLGDSGAMEVLSKSSSELIQTLKDNGHIQLSILCRMQVCYPCLGRRVIYLSALYSCAFSTR